MSKQVCPGEAASCNPFEASHYFAACYHAMLEQAYCPEMEVDWEAVAGGLVANLHKRNVMLINHSLCKRTMRPATLSTGTMTI